MRAHQWEVFARRVGVAVWFLVSMACALAISVTCLTGAIYILGVIT